MDKTINHWRAASVSGPLHSSCLRLVSECLIELSLVVTGVHICYVGVNDSIKFYLMFIS